MIAVVICVAVIAALGAGFAVGVRFARVRRDKDEAFGVLHLQTCTEASHERRLIIGNRSRGQTMRTTREASP